MMSTDYRIEKKINQCIEEFYSVAADKGMTPREYRGEIIATLLTALAGFIGDIECPSCRKEAADFTKSELPPLIDDVLAERHEEETAPSGSEHVH
jgi:hypothetical protein